MRGTMPQRPPTRRMKRIVALIESDASSEVHGFACDIKAEFREIVC
jgi:hypothetical protein